VSRRTDVGTWPCPSCTWPPTCHRPTRPTPPAILKLSNTYQLIVVKLDLRSTHPKQPNHLARWPLDLKHSDAPIGRPLSLGKIPPWPRGVGCALGLTSRSPVATERRALADPPSAHPLVWPAAAAAVVCASGSVAWELKRRQGRVCHWRRRRLRPAPTRAAAGVDRPTFLAARCPKPPLLERCLCS